MGGYVTAGAAETEILITDGNANVSMGDMDPSKEAILVGEMIRARKIRSIVLGTGGQGSPAACCSSSCRFPCSAVS